MATKAERVYQEVNQLIDSGVEKRDAFKQLAERYQQPLDSIRGAFYGWKKRIEGGGSRPRKRETTTADAIAAAQATLQKALEAIDREVAAAEDRAAEATAEAKALEASADARKGEIEAKITALES